jgi:hypothetical protein
VSRQLSLSVQELRPLSGMFRQVLCVCYKLNRKSARFFLGGTQDKTSLVTVAMALVLTYKDCFTSLCSYPSFPSVAPFDAAQVQQINA